MDDRKSNGATPIIVGTALVVLLIVVYVLSCGPSTRLAQEGYVSQEAMYVVYAPLGWLEDHSSVCRFVLEWYADFWRQPPSSVVG